MRDAMSSVPSASSAAAAIRSNGLASAATGGYDPIGSLYATNDLASAAIRSNGLASAATGGYDPIGSLYATNDLASAAIRSNGLASAATGGYDPIGSLYATNDLASAAIRSNGLASARMELATFSGPKLVTSLHVLYKAGLLVSIGAFASMPIRAFRAHQNSRAGACPGPMRQGALDDWLFSRFHDLCWWRPDHAVDALQQWFVPSISGILLRHREHLHQVLRALARACSVSSWPLGASRSLLPLRAAAAEITSVITRHGPPFSPCPELRW
jgi:hypothetical protein